MLRILMCMGLFVLTSFSLTAATQQQEAMWNDFQELFSITKWRPRNPGTYCCPDESGIWFRRPIVINDVEYADPPDLRIGDLVKEMPKHIYLPITNEYGYFTIRLDSNRKKNRYDSVCIETMGYVDPQHEKMGIGLNKMSLRQMYIEFKRRIEAVGLKKTDCLSRPQVRGEYVRYVFDDERFIGMTLTYPADNPEDDERTNLQINMSL